MNHTQRSVIKRRFLSAENPCETLKFDECEELHAKYKKAFNAPGCSACAQRRAKNKFGELVRQKTQDLDFDTVFQN